MADFGLRMSVKANFFDRRHVIDAVARANKRNLSYHAGMVRKIARRSLKRVPKNAAKKLAERVKKERAAARRQRRPMRPIKDRTVSRPGQPPKIHSPGDMNPKKILYAYQPSTETAVVGPVRFNTRFNAVEALEYGGRVPIYSGRGRRRRLIRHANVRARPFMRPAEAKARPYMAQRWANSVKPIRRSA